MSNGTRRRRLMASGLTGEHYYGTVTGIYYATDGGHEYTVDEVLDSDYIFQGVYVTSTAYSTTFTTSTYLYYVVDDYKVINYDTGETTEKSSGRVRADYENLHLTYNGFYDMRFSGSAGSFYTDDSSFEGNATASVSSYGITFKVTGIPSNSYGGAIPIEFPSANIQLYFYDEDGNRITRKSLSNPDLSLYLRLNVN